MAGKECVAFLSSNVHLEKSVSSDYDGIVIIGTALCPKALGVSEKLIAPFVELKKNDESFEKQPTLAVVDGVRVVYSPTGPLNRDQDDIRVFSSACISGVKRLLNSGSKKVLVVLPVSHAPFSTFNCAASTVLGALESLYVPLEIREDVPARRQKVERLGFLNFNESKEVFRYLLDIEAGRSACRDIGGSDPERMAPPRVATYIKDLFEGSVVTAKVISTRDELIANYPCFAAVDRCASHVERHNARMIHLEYCEGTPEVTLALVGKGVTYDTGGADVKAGGHMAGMHRDKCGAAAVAGFFQTLALAKPKNIRVLGAMCMVRNSIGADCYVSDEIITSRAGVRVRVGNTDAEGRMAMVDALAEMKERLVKEGSQDKAHLFTIATLTGHACLAVGEPYSIVLDNGPAKAGQSAEKLRNAGDDIGDLFEMSTIRKEDYDFVVGKSEYEDILQCNNEASSRTPRGHQMPAAFLIRVAGLDKHGKDSQKPLAYSHLDIAASSGPYPGIPSGAPLAALAHRYIFSKLTK